MIPTTTGTNLISTRLGPSAASTALEQGEEIRVEPFRVSSAMQLKWGEVSTLIFPHPATDLFLEEQFIQFRKMFGDDFPHVFSALSSNDTSSNEDVFNRRLDRSLIIAIDNRKEEERLAMKQIDDESEYEYEDEEEAAAEKLIIEQRHQREKRERRDKAFKSLSSLLVSAYTDEAVYRVSLQVIEIEKLRKKVATENIAKVTGSSFVKTVSYELINDVVQHSRQRILYDLERELLTHLFVEGRGGYERFDTVPEDKIDEKLKWQQSDESEAMKNSLAFSPDLFSYLINDVTDSSGSSPPPAENRSESPMKIQFSIEKVNEVKPPAYLVKNRSKLTPFELFDQKLAKEQAEKEKSNPKCVSKLIDPRRNRLADKAKFGDEACMSKSVDNDARLANIKTKIMYDPDFIDSKETTTFRDPFKEIIEKTWVPIAPTPLVDLIKSPAKTSTTFSLSERVEAQFDDGEWYGATIATIVDLPESSYILITWDLDGSEMRLPKSKVRRLDAAGPSTQAGTHSSQNASPAASHKKLQANSSSSASFSPAAAILNLGINTKKPTPSTSIASNNIGVELNRTKSENLLSTSISKSKSNIGINSKNSNNNSNNRGNSRRNSRGGERGTVKVATCGTADAETEATGEDELYADKTGTNPKVVSRTLYTELLDTFWKNPIIISVVSYNRVDRSASENKAIQLIDKECLLLSTSSEQFPDLLCIKAFDVVLSRGSIVKIKIREYVLFLYELREMYGDNVLLYYRPGNPSWWVNHVLKIVNIIQRPNGDIVLRINKKLIEKNILKEMKDVYDKEQEEKSRKKKASQASLYQMSVNADGSESSVVNTDIHVRPTSSSKLGATASRSKSPPKVAEQAISPYLIPNVWKDEPKNPFKKKKRDSREFITDSSSLKKENSEEHSRSKASDKDLKENSTFTGLSTLSTSTTRANKACKKVIWFPENDDMPDGYVDVSERVSRDIIRRAREAVSGSWSFRNRVFTQSEKTLFSSPFAQYEIIDDEVEEEA